MNQNRNRFWGIIVAGGTGERFGADLPKQYQRIMGKPMLLYSLNLFCSYPQFSGTILVQKSQDEYWHRLNYSHSNLLAIAVGGDSRPESVLSGLKRLSGYADKDDWVFVHDAARPCITTADLDKLINVLTSDEDGAILACRVTDTLKQYHHENARIHTLSRTGLWQASTPQAFRMGQLISSLEKALADEVEVSDESCAMEYCGFSPICIAGRTDNIKVTTRDDLDLAEAILSYRLSKDAS